MRRSVGYHYAGLAPGTHLGLLSPSLTLVINLGPDPAGQDAGVPAGEPSKEHRIARFDRSKQALRTSTGNSLAGVAAACGYFDQSHLAREWNQLAGCAPSRWLSSEELSFIQDGEAPVIAGLTA